MRMTLVPLIPPPSIFRRLVEALIVLGVLALVMAGAWWTYGYFTHGRPLSQVEVYVALDDPLCRSRADSPVFVGVINGSSRTVGGMTFVLEARPAAGGDNLQSDFVYTDSNRIPPGGAIGDCWPANYESVETETVVRASDLTWRIVRHDFTFTD